MVTMIPRRSAWLLALVLSLWFRSDVNFAPKKHMDAGWSQVVDATYEVSSATKHLMTEPFSPENAASWAKVASGQVLRGVNAAALPARWSLQIATATVLAPLSLRLQRLASKPPSFARAQMRKACDLLKVEFKCPELFMLEVGEAALQTLPLNTPKGKVDWAVFVSSHLAKVSTRDQLLALLLREVSLLRMRVPPLPQLWALLAAAKPTSAVRRSKAKLKTKGAKVARKGDQKKGQKGLEVEQLQQHFFHTLEELCRIHLGIHALRVRLNQLPSSWRPNVAKTAGRFQLPGVLGDGADVIGSYADGGLMASLYQAGNHVEDYMGRYQPMRIGHIKLLKEDLLGKDKTQKSLMKQVRDTRTALDRVYSIGPERVEGLLEKASKIRHPRRFWRRKPRRNLHLVELWATASSLSRFSTLAADREAVQAMGSIDALAGGLVLLHGTATQKRQLQRGELRSLLEDAQADFPAKQRWPLWFEAFTKGSMEPVLILRLAELRDIEEKYGWKAASGSWLAWLMSCFGR